ncbi:DUF2029 domain-containing protein [Trinickia caryophylli]|nr:DUF2029 domain-containing protein [Trinickia caryophylli]TRX15316.1 DUF2029 domain-containing protein [Trinickia caryophylli]
MALLAARLRALRRRPHWATGERLRFYSIGALVCYVLWLAIYFYKAIWNPHGYMSPLALDFLPFWSASHLALHGQAVDAYNLAILEKLESATIQHSVGILPWLYPPTFLLFVLPFALVPWKIAAAAFLCATYLLFMKAMHRIVPVREAVFVAAAFPGAALAIAAGQNGLLTASLIAFGLSLLPRRPVLAGLCLGLLSMKPQLAVLVPLALLCSRSWRTLASFSAISLSMLAASVLAFGFGTLEAFLANMNMAAGFVETGQAALARIPSMFSMVKLAHGPTTLAYAVQAASALAAAAAVCYAWLRHASHALRAATLVCASLMVSPYLYDYDLAWYGVLIAWMCRHGLEQGWRAGEREWLVLLWLLPFAGILVVTRIHVQFMPLVSAATLAWLVRRIALDRCEFRRWGDLLGQR